VQIVPSKRVREEMVGNDTGDVDFDDGGPEDPTSKKPRGAEGEARKEKWGLMKSKIASSMFFWSMRNDSVWTQDTGR